MSGEAFTIWSVRLATLLYVVALVLWLTAKNSTTLGRARLFWTSGCLLYLAHVFGAFEFFHGWSHAAAYGETARQTAVLTGMRWGGGLYFNYLFTAVWVIDVLWWWSGIAAYERRPRAVTLAIHVFLAFLFFNGTVVFAEGFSRWLGVAATPLLLWLAFRLHGVRTAVPDGPIAAKRRDN